jgi:hypothetical protein
MTFVRRALFPTALALIVIAQLVIVVPGLFRTRLWEDEAYNLTVALNMLAGHGYASDGILSGGHMLLFDPRISTGPTVLLPVTAMLSTGIDLVLGARIVMLLFYAALLVGLWLLGRGVAGGLAGASAGRWGGLVAMTLPLALNLKQMPSPVQGPTDILGELPAAMFLVFALYLWRRHPLWAGLMAGLAVQTKFIALLAVPALLVAVLLSEPRVDGRWNWGARVLRAVWFGVAVAVPTVLVELWKLITLGWGGYLAETHEFVRFVRTGGQADVVTSPGAKLGYLANSWFVPAWAGLLLVVLAVAVVVVVWRGRVSRRSFLTPQPAEPLRWLRSARNERVSKPAAAEAVFTLGIAVITLIAWLAWWLLSAHTPAWIRYPGPALIAFVPVLAAGLVAGIRMLWRSPASDRARAGGRVLAGATTGLLVVLIGAQAVMHGFWGWTPFWNETLTQQRAAASAVSELGEPALQSYWGPGVSLVVLAGSRSVLRDAPSAAGLPMVYFTYQLTAAQQAAFDRTIDANCSRVLVRTGAYVVCQPIG